MDNVEDARIFRAILNRTKWIWLSAYWFANILPPPKVLQSESRKGKKQTLAAITVILTYVRLCDKDWMIFQSKLEQTILIIK